MSDTAPPLVEIKPPRLMSISRGSVGPLIQFLDTIERETVSGRRVMLDLRECEFISRTAGLLLTAQIERSTARRPFSVNGYSPTDLGVCGGLHGLGFYDHLKFHSPLDTPDVPEDSITVCSGRGVTDDLSQRLAEVAQVSYPLFGDTDFADQVHGALNEAITNIIGHAYLKESTDFRLGQLDMHERATPLPLAREPHGLGLFDYWWFAGHVDVERGELSLVAIDHGGTVPGVARRGIPEILAAYWQEFPPKRRRLPRQPADADVLEAVAKARRAKIGTGRRGKGFPTMIGLVENIGSSGSVTVLSGSALYQYRKYVGVRAPLERCFALNKSFGGTLIEWRISGPVPAKKEG